MAPRAYYVVNKLIRWSDIKVEVNGVERALPRPTDSKIIGFMPVYDDLETAVQDGDGYTINALSSGGFPDDQEETEEETDGDDTETS